VPASEYWNLIAKSRESPLLALIYRVPPRLWREISNIQDQLKSVDQRQLFAKPSTFHITVKVLSVLGENVDQRKLETLLSRTQEIVREFPPFEVSLKGLGIFPTSIYVKVEDRLDQLRMINKRILAKLGDQVEKAKYDGDSYIPHITIATFNTREAQELISKVRSQEMQEIEFGCANVFELEAAEARMYLLLGPVDTQDEGLAYLRTLHLSGERALD
jgi:RNA 2',3'-cyclic 3'-phosphodiesterase